MTTTNKKTDWKKYAVFAGMGLLFLGAMYWILAPSSKNKEEQTRGMGLNTEVPAPARSEMVEDKRTAYEQEMLMQKQQERMKTLADFINVTDVENDPTVIVDDLSLVDEKPKTPAQKPRSSGGGRSSAQSSVDAYRDMNRTLGSFYEQPKEDERVKQLTEQVETLQSQLESQPTGISMDEQLALMEKSYQMASKYLPQGTAGTSGLGGGNGVSGGNGTLGTNAPVAEPVQTSTSTKTGKTEIVPITGVREQVVSALPQNISNAEFVATYSQERNIGFFSPETGTQSTFKNTIRACIHDDQTVSEGSETQRNVRIRLTEPMSAGGTVIPAHTILTGHARIGERLDVTITSIEYMGRIYATDIIVYDVDGQRGIAIPPSMEANALREVAANTGSSMGTSITFSQSAGQQIAADVGKGVVQGTSQYIAKKMRVVKIHLKAGHQIFLLPKEI